MESNPVRPKLSILETINNNPSLSPTNSISWEPKWEANEIIEGLYHGAIDSAFDKEGLEKHNITHIVHIENYFRPKFPEDFNYLVCDVEDHGGKEILFVIEKAIPFIRKGRKKGNVLVHCAAGISRSSTVIIAYLLSDCKSDFDWKDVHDCRAWLRTKRKRADPQPGFVRCLLELEKNSFDFKSKGMVEYIGNLKTPSIETKKQKRSTKKIVENYFSSK
jgi:hypothetical protein